MNDRHSMPPDWVGWALIAPYVVELRSTRARSGETFDTYER